MFQEYYDWDLFDDFYNNSDNFEYITSSEFSDIVDLNNLTIITI